LAAEGIAQARTIPVVDASGLTSPAVDARRRVAASLRETFETVGFAYIANHGVPQAAIDAAFAASREFHGLPLEAKLAIRVNAAHRGYMPMATSTIVTSSVAKVTRPNLSESLMVMHELAPDDPAVLAGLPLQGVNQWPDLPGFRDTILAYNGALEALARRLTAAVALGFGLAEDFFAPHFRRPTTWLRLLHYPPQPPDDDEAQFGSAPHTDYGFLTILAQDSAGGLEVRARDGTWLAAPPLSGTFVINVADILMRWTDGVLVSTPHRVRNLSGRDRYSIPFFYDPAMDTVVERLPGINEGAPPRWPPVCFGDYVMERLDKNYAYRKQAQAAGS
jgi:isopenicillin N synthase-like dioxygenase